MGRMGDELELGRGHPQGKARRSSCGRSRTWRGPSLCGRKIHPNNLRTSSPKDRLPYNVESPAKHSVRECLEGGEVARGGKLLVAKGSPKFSTEVSKRVMFQVGN